MKVFGSSGVRGVVGETITPAFVGQVAKAAGSSLGSETVAVARDTRRTGEMLADAAAGGLAAVGSDVHRLGIVPTPAAQAYAERAGIPVVMITASHNPPAYNGVKLVGRDGVELSRDALERIEDRLLADRYEPRSWDETGESERVEAVRHAYVEQLLDAVNREQIADADLTGRHRQRPAGRLLPRSRPGTGRREPRRAGCSRQNDRRGRGYRPRRRRRPRHLL